jgi:hypothetical protein
MLQHDRSLFLQYFPLFRFFKYNTSLKIFAFDKHTSLLGKKPYMICSCIRTRLAWPSASSFCRFRSRSIHSFSSLAKLETKIDSFVQLSFSSVRAHSHPQIGSSNFAEWCNFNRNPPIFSNRHRWQQQQHVMFYCLCKHHLTDKKSSGLQYKPMTILNDDSRVINKLEASLTDDARVIIYDCHMFIVQASGQYWLFSDAQEYSYRVRMA